MAGKHDANGPSGQELHGTGKHAIRTGDRRATELEKQYKGQHRASETDDRK